ncbi:MAG TPA: tetratricopeptide repeat protein [Oligoflexia bacterium]|nr:tetratricopeptide repeat protein [Oligoflexia bacterium]HMP47727.1 tetratricopeptide repeat protein [Oligoflexia bacterium]
MRILDLLKESFLFFSLLFYFTGCSAGLESRMNRDFKEVRSIQAEQTSQIAEMRQEIRELTGRLDELNHQSQGRSRALENEINKLGSRVPPPSGVPESVLVSDENNIAKIKGSAAEEYQNALKYLRTGDFESAHQFFSRFAADNPGTAFTDNALFWSGISSMKLGRLERSIVEFSEVFQKYPAEDMVAPSLYYMAESLFNLGSGNDGVLTLQKLVEEHPKSEFAIRARERLGNAAISKPAVSKQAAPRPAVKNSKGRR